jgi:agmatinase
LDKKNLSKKICWANTSSFDDSDIVIVGIPDESGSHAYLKGTSKAPDTIRRVSNERDIYVEGDLKCLALPAQGLPATRVYDYGNIKKQQISEVIDKITSSSKIPVLMGGDHSLTTPIIKALAKKHQPISLVYFDAHPDFVNHTRNYYGSIITDSLQYLDVKSSVMVGIRTPEETEIDNIKKHGFRVITPFDVVESGINQITKTILNTVKGNVYISLDVDCFDPAYAPGASVPVPLGLASQDVTYLIKKIVQRRIVGLDIVEVCPPTDLNDVTSHLASRIIGEVISSCKV